MLVKIVYFLTFHLLICETICDSELNHCETINGKGERECENKTNFYSRKRYIFYDVNPQEGFNLRRDVYVRVATFVKQLVEMDKEHQWHLVLPPFGNLYHWNSGDVGSQKQIPWGIFFDIDSLKKYTSVLEMYEFLKDYSTENGETTLDIVYFLQNDEEMFRTGNFEDKNIISDCPKTGFRYKKRNDRFSGYFWGYSNITARKVQCVTFHGTTFDLKKNLQPTQHRTIMFDHMEIPLHYAYGSADYWKARRSMRYNLELYKIADEFRFAYLKSNDLDDNTQKPQDWRLEKSKRDAIGGPYLAVHFRRQDFLIGRSAITPTTENAATQIRKILKLLKLNVVFIATDTGEKEFGELKNLLSEYSVLRFIPSLSVRKKFKDGGVAIIDQIICAYARYFIGTHESTFTFRIQEEREILGFPANTTFNHLCKDEKECPLGSRWKIVWD